MPKIKFIGAQKAQKGAALGTLLMGRKALYQLTFADIGSRVGISKDTVLSEFRDPGRMRLDRLPKYARALDIPKEEILAALPW